MLITSELCNLVDVHMIILKIVVAITATIDNHYICNTIIVPGPNHGTIKNWTYARS